ARQNPARDRDRGAHDDVLQADLDPHETHGGPVRAATVDDAEGATPIVWIHTKGSPSASIREGLLRPRRASTQTRRATRSMAAPRVGRRGPRRGQRVAAAPAAVRAERVARSLAWRTPTGPVPAPAAVLFPLLSVDSPEFGELVADIGAHGLLQPIVLHEGMIL